MEEEFKPEDQEEQEDSSSWLKDNLRIIISIIIVIVIAGGIYSFSKRSQTLLNEQQVSTEEKAATKDGSVEIKPEDNTNSQKQIITKEIPSTVATSKETDASFIETAVKGNGQTHLARRALANYLEKNADSELTAEHKIYIEDYLRKKSGFKGGVRIGSTIEFSKDKIKEAIEASKKLNDKQLKNLHKYAVRVPSLS